MALPADPSRPLKLPNAAEDGDSKRYPEGPAASLHVILKASTDFENMSITDIETYLRHKNFSTTMWMMNFGTYFLSSRPPGGSGASVMKLLGIIRMIINFIIIITIIFLITQNYHNHRRDNNDRANNNKESSRWIRRIINSDIPKYILWSPRLGLQFGTGINPT